MIPVESTSGMPSAPLVSVVMPAYNSARTLEAAVRSVIAQTFPEWELLIIDDGSQDTSRALATELASQESRIQTIFLDRNHGAAAARNVGVQRARGRYIAFLDSDDVWLPRKIEVQLEAMRRMGAAISFTDYQWMDASGNLLDFLPAAPDSVGYHTLLRGNVIGLSTSIVDREKAPTPLMPPLRLNHDYAMWLSMTRDGSSALRIPEILTYYRHQAGSLSGNKLESLWTNFKILHSQESICFLRAGWLVSAWACKSVCRRLRHGLLF